MFTYFLLRYNKRFNKSRYSRNRQLVRVIFYFTLYINILIIFGIYSVFYGIIFKFSIVWWVLFIFFLSCIIPSFLRVIFK